VRAQRETMLKLASGRCRFEQTDAEQVAQRFVPAGACGEPAGEQAHEHAAEKVHDQRAPGKARSPKCERGAAGEMPCPGADRAAEHDEKEVVHPVPLEHFHIV